MAVPPIESAKEQIIELAKDEKYTKARDKLDILFTKFGNLIDKQKIISELDRELRAAGIGLSYVLKGDPIQSHTLVHNAFGETIEADYYWILDFLRDGGYDVAKSADFFSASEASGYFESLGARRAALEKRAIELMGTINLVVKSVIQLLYDLKQFDLRLETYDNLKSKDKEVKKSAMEGLKAIWLLEVDRQKGPGAIDSLATNLSYITLRDAFMVVPIQDWYVEKADSKKISDIKKKAADYVAKMDLADIVKRVLSPRIQEFITWLYLSEKELRNRRAVEKAYLKSQVQALKTYTRWVRPYLIATQKLIPAEYRELQAKHKELGLGPEVAPTPFHVVWSYLELFGTKKAKLLAARKIPGYGAEEIKLKDEDNRPLFAQEVRIAFRGTPVPATSPKGERVFAFTGKKVIMFVSYVLQKKHKKILDSLEDDEVLQFIDVMTKESLDALKEDLEKYLEEKPEEKKEKPKAEIPFASWVKETFGTLAKFQAQAKELYEKLPKLKLSSKEAWTIARLMLVAKEKAEKDCNKIFTIYRKSRKMLTP